MQNAELDFAGEISRVFADLSPKLKLAARFVVENQYEVASRSLRQIAGQSGLSPPTFSRLARAIGFEEYEALRQRCRTEIQHRQVSLAQRASLIRDFDETLSPETRGSLAGRHSKVAVSNIQELIESVDTDHLADAADCLANAREVVLLGGQSSNAVLSYLQHIASLATPNWKIIGSPETTGPAGLVDADHETVLLAVSIAPYLRRTVNLAERAAYNGVPVIAVTDDMASPLLKHSKYSFLAPTHSKQFFPSHVAILTLLEIIGGMVVRRLGEKASQRIERVEKLSHAIGDYV